MIPKQENFLFSTNQRFDSCVWSPCGRFIAIALLDGGSLVWDLYPPPLMSLNTTMVTIERAITFLTLSDAKSASAAIQILVSHPEQSLPLLGKLIISVPNPDPKKLKDLINSLNNPEYAVREQAMKELEGLGRTALPAIRLGVHESDSAETQKRLVELLAKLRSKKTTTDELRAFRAIEIVELIGNPDAVRLLNVWSSGAEGALLTDEAKLALVRLRKRLP